MDDAKLCAPNDVASPCTAAMSTPGRCTAVHSTCKPPVWVAYGRMGEKGRRGGEERDRATVLIIRDVLCVCFEQRGKREKEGTE